MSSLWWWLYESIHMLKCIELYTRRKRKSILLYVIKTKPNVDKGSSREMLGPWGRGSYFRKVLVVWRSWHSAKNLIHA